MSFFEGWRRKLGVVTLGLAIVLIWGWTFQGFNHLWNITIAAGMNPRHVPVVADMFYIKDREPRDIAVVVLPLVLLSALLLFWPSRKTTPQMPNPNINSN